MNPLQFCITLILFPLMLGCASSENQADRGTVDSTKADSTREDTSVSTLKPPPPAPSPGTVRLKGKILGYALHSDTSVGNGKDIIMKLRITAVEEYGSSTPAVAVTDTLAIKVPHADSTMVCKHIGKIVSAVISYRESPTAMKSLPDWHLIRLQPAP